MGILSDAQSCSFDCGSEFGRRPGPGHRRGALPLHSTDQLPRKVARLSVAGAFCFLRDGRAVSAGGGAIRRVESGAGRLGRRCRRLAVEQCEGTSVRARRPLGECRADVGDGRRLARIFEQRDSGRRTSRLARTWPQWASVRKRHVCGPIGASFWPNPSPAENRSAVDITQTSIIGAPGMSAVKWGFGYNHPLSPR